MAELIINAHLAEQIRMIAEQEQRPIESILAAMIENYSRVSVSSHAAYEPPISESELDAIAQRVGAMGSLSALIIEERKHGW